VFAENVLQTQFQRIVASDESVSSSSFHNKPFMSTNFHLASRSFSSLSLFFLHANNRFPIWLDTATTRTAVPMPPIRAKSNTSSTCAACILVTPRARLRSSHHLLSLYVLLNAHFLPESFQFDNASIFQCLIHFPCVFESETAREGRPQEEQREEPGLSEVEACESVWRP
jgi:hypothetical protein